MEIKKIGSELLDGAKFVDHFSGGKILAKHGRYLADTFLSTTKLFVINTAGAFVLVGALGLIWWNWDRIKSMTASVWEDICNLYEATSELYTSTLDAAWYWLGFEDGPEEPA